MDTSEQFPGIFTQDHPGVQTKSSDYALAGGRGLRTPYAFRRVSPRFPPLDGSQFGFNGDYTGLVVIGNIAHPIWSDTRNVNPFTGFHDEDVFTDAVPVPDGRGERNDD